MSVAVLSEAPGRAAVGRRVRVYWVDEKEWFEGEVVAYCERDGRHKLVYDDGDVEEVWLASERFVWEKDEHGRVLHGDQHKAFVETPPGKGAERGAGGGKDAEDPGDPPPKRPEEMGPGDLVWGKVKGHGYWPGRIVDHRKHNR